MRITLKTKIWFTILTVVLMFSFFSLYYFPAQEEKYMLDSYNNEVQNLANINALGVKIAVENENFKSISTALSFVQADPRLIYAKFFFIDTIWSDDHIHYTLKDTLFATIPDKLKGDSFSYTDNSIIKKRSEFTTENQFSGTVELAFTTDNIKIGKTQIRQTSLIVSGVVFVIGILIGFWLSRNISVPVLALRDAAYKVGDGDLAQRVRFRSGDEIGELAKAFNKMVEDLARAREELRKANLDLASANKALHKTLNDLKSAQDQLIQAEKMASLGQLTAGIAHEINNPINFVSANIKPLRDDMADILKITNHYEKIIKEKGLEKEFLEIRQFKHEADIDLTMKEVNNLLKGIEDGAMRTAEIIKGLRNFSRIDQNVFKKANLNDCLESTLTLLHSSYKNRIEIEKQYGDIPEVDCFPGQINQVLMNILSNAIQAIQGEGRIFIKSWQANDKIKISIKDTGVGMTEDIRKKIFDPFFTTKDVGKGTGLGLSISYSIIQKHNGEIQVFSKPGAGTEFLITIPIKQQLTT